MPPARHLAWLLLLAVGAHYRPARAGGGDEPAAAETVRQAAAALASGQLARVIRLAQSHRARLPGGRQRALLDFMQFLALERGGRAAAALRLAREGDWQDLPACLEAHLQALAAITLAGQARLPPERQRAAARLRAVPLFSRHGHEARFARLQLLRRSGAWERCAELARDTATRLARRPAESRALLIEGRCLEGRARDLYRSGQARAARAALGRAAARYRLARALWPGRAPAQQAAQHLERLRTAGIRPQDHQAAWLLERARLLARHPRGRRDLRRLLRLRRLVSGPAASPTRCAVDLLAAELAVRFRWFRTARRLLRRVRRRAQDGGQRARAALDLASLTARYNFSAALQAYSEVARLWPGSEAAAWALLRGGQMLYRRGNLREAAGWLRRALAAGREDRVAARARFELARLEAAGGHPDRALPWLDAVCQAAPAADAGKPAPPALDLTPAAEPGEEELDPGAADPAAPTGPEPETETAGEVAFEAPSFAAGDDWRLRALYWRARYRELSGDRAGAVADLVAAIERRPFSYYAVLAGGRLRELGEPHPFQGLASAAGDPRLPAVDHPELQAARAYRELGLATESRATLLALDREALDFQQRTALARAWLELGEPSGAVWSSPLPFAGSLPGFPKPLVLAAARLAYPRAFFHLVEGDDRDPRVAPELVYALMRAESSFRPRARSPAGALGLTQLIRRTAWQTARRHRVRGFRFWQLLRPEVAIGLGSAHLGDLLERYCGNPVLAFAAYNAGGRAVDDWLSKLPGGDLDVFVAGIPYLETGRYVRKLVSFVAIYRALYHKDYTWAPPLRIAPELLAGGTGPGAGPR